MTVINQQGLLEIDDAEGELHLYRCAVAPPGLALWAMRLTRLDTGAEYRTRHLKDDRWDCECPAWKFRKRGTGPCKHILALQGLRVLLRGLEVEEIHAC